MAEKADSPSLDVTEIVSVSKSLPFTDVEGCLSFPDIRATRKDPLIYANVEVRDRNLLFLMRVPAQTSVSA